MSTGKITDERTSNVYYQAQIELTPDSYQKPGNIELVSCMPAEILIRTRERTVFEYLVQSITNAFACALIEDYCMNNITSLVICLFLAHTRLAYAEDLLTIYQQAIEADPTLKSAGLKAEIGSAQKGQAFGEMLPQVSASANWSANNQRQIALTYI